jgi:enoyl-CoA hydratase/carnithine racemase
MIRVHHPFPESLDTLLLDSPREGLLRVRLNRPEVANAMSTQMGHDIIAVFAGLEAEPERYRCVMLTGVGSRFCGGADLKERDGMTDEQFNTQHYLFERMMRAIYDCPVPVLACLNGPAVAGGLELALACDFIVASDRARCGFTEVSRGIMPGGGGTQHLPRAIGVRKAKELMFTGDLISADEAKSLGLYNHVFPDDQVVEKTLAMIDRILANAPISIRQVKKSIEFGAQMDTRTGLFFEVEAYSRLVATDDRREGIRAFNEKRAPRFSGR